MDIAGLDRIEHRDEPLYRPCTLSGAFRQQCFAALADVQYDSSGLEKDEAILLENRYLAEGL